jgi:hypothetical protein
VFEIHTLLHLQNKDTSEKKNNSNDKKEAKTIVFFHHNFASQHNTCTDSSCLCEGGAYIGGSDVLLELGDRLCHSGAVEQQMQARPCARHVGRVLTRNQKSNHPFVAKTKEKRRKTHIYTKVPL